MGDTKLSTNSSFR